MEMKIKEVEEKTKLSAKAIRLYEEKGLLTISRDMNGYREYYEDNIQELLTIKLYRQCGLSLAQIEDIKKDPQILEELLYDMIDEYDKKDLEISEQKDLCLDVIKAKGEYNELFEYIEVRESDEVNALINEVMNIPKRSLAIQLFISIMLLGPILNFLLFLSEEHIERLLGAFIFSIISTIILTLSWKNFLSEYKFHKETLKEGLLHTLRILIMIVLVIVCMIGVFAGLTYIQHLIYLKDDFYIMCESNFSIFFLLMTTVSLFIFVLSQYASRYQFEEYNHYIDITKWIQKHHKVYLGSCLLVIYLFMVNVTVISPHQIVCHTYINPLGTTYSYDDIESVECGFYENSFYYFHEKGEFYYKVYMKDGTSFAMKNTETIEKYEDDTYSEIEEFDKEVMKHNVKKFSSDKYSQYAMLGQVYIDRFIAIINNK